MNDLMKQVKDLKDKVKEYKRDIPSVITKQGRFKQDNQIPSQMNLPTSFKETNNRIIFSKNFPRTNSTEVKI